jgi:hypothetical protein
MDTEIIPVETQPTLAMLRDDLETIARGDTENIQQRLVDDFPNLISLFR